MSENHEPVEVDRLTESEQLSGLPSDGHDELIELNAALDADAVPMISTPMPPPPPSSPNVQSRRKLRAVALVFVFVAAGFGSGILGTIAADKWDITIGSTKISGSSNAPLVTSEVGSDDPSLGTTVVAQVVNKLADSVVTINSQVNDASGQGEASGTGVVLTADG